MCVYVIYALCVLRATHHTQVYTNEETDTDLEFGNLVVVQLQVYQPCVASSVGGRQW